MPSLFDRLKSAAKSVSYAVDQNKGKAWGAVQSTAKKVVQAGVALTQPSPKEAALVAPIGQGLSLEQKRRADEVVKKQIESQRAEEVFKKKQTISIPQPVKTFAREVAPKSYEDLATLKSSASTPVQRLKATLALPLRVPQEVIVQQAAKLFRGIAEPIAYGGKAEAVPTYQAKSWPAKQLFGEAPVENLVKRTTGIADVAYNAAKNLPQVKNLPENSFGKKSIPLVAGILGAGLGGGLEGLNADVGIGGAAKKGVEKVIKEAGEQAAKKATFGGLKDLSTKIVEKLKGKSTVSKQFIADLTNSGDVKQVERDLIRRVLEKEGDQVDVAKFADTVKDELLPIKVTDTKTRLRNDPNADEYFQNPNKYESVTLPPELRGDVANYKENVYESPIKTSAGSTHFPGQTENYFGHSRVEDMADGKTRRVIEVQSDLYQKGRLDKELQKFPSLSDEQRSTIQREGGTITERNAKTSAIQERGRAEKQKLSQYNDPTAHFRMIREEVKKAAQDGKSELLFPTGETAMKVEGLGQNTDWYRLDANQRLSLDNMKPGMPIQRDGDQWVIIDVLGDGKFKAVGKRSYDANDAWKIVEDTMPGGDMQRLAINEKTGASYVERPGKTAEQIIQENKDLALRVDSETFDISGKVDQNNPIYKFYEKEVGKYLKNNYKAVPFTDEKGVSWMKVLVSKEIKDAPVEAFGALAGMEPQFDEQGNITGFTFNPEKAVVGVAGMSVSQSKIGKEFIGKSKEAWEKYLLKEAEAGKRLMLQGSSEFESGYAAFKKLAQRSPDFRDDTLDYAGMVKRLKKTGQTPQQIENKFFSSANGGDLSNDEILSKFRERLKTEKEFGPLSKIQKTNSGYIFNGSNQLPALPANKDLPISKTEGTPILQQKTVSPEQTLEESLIQRTKAAQQEFQARGKSTQNGPQSLGDPLRSSVDSSSGRNVSFEANIVPPGTNVKDKVNILDYIRTPENVLKKLGLGKEAELLKQKYDDYLRELPIEIGRITSWSKEVPGQDASKRLFQFLDGKDVKLQGNEPAIAAEIRAYLRDWARKLDIPETNQISHYITHIFEDDFLAKEFDPDLARIITDRVARSVYDPFLQKRMGAQGYIEDVWMALDAYTKRAVRKSNMDVALKPLEQAANRLDVDSYKYIESLTARVNMRPTEMDNLFDNLVKSSPIGYKLGQRPLARISRKVRQAVYRGTLGLNPGSALRNLTQGVNTYAELGEKYTIKGYVDFAKSLKSKSTELYDSGVLRDGFVQDRVLSVQKKFWEKFDKVLFSFFEGAEKINRGSAYFGAKAKALASGKSEEEAIAYAKKLVEKTQFKFGSVDTPVALQSDIAKILTQFQSFNVKQTEFLVGKFKNKEWAGLIRYALGSALLIGGAGNLMGLSPGDFIPFSGVISGRTKLGETPPIKAAGTIAGALADAPDAYGNQRTLGKKLKDVGNSLLPFVPMGVQAKKVYGGIEGVLDGGVDVTQNHRKGFETIDSLGEAAKAIILGPYSIMEPERKRLDKKGALLKSIQERTAIVPELQHELKGKAAGAFNRNLQQAKDTETMDSANAKVDAQMLDTELKNNKSLDAAGRIQKIQELKKKSPAAYNQFIKMVKEEAKTAKNGALTYEEDKMQNLGVESGARAKFINEYVEQLPKEKRVPYIIELKKKGIITSDVLRQMLKLPVSNTTSSPAAEPVSVRPGILGGRALGKLSERFESKGDPGIIGYDSTGGLSYGSWQMAHNNAYKFITRSPFAGDFKGLKFNSSAWQAKWKEVAERKPDAFKDEQFKFIAATHYKPVVDRLKALGVDTTRLSQAMKDVIWSTAVQHGPGTQIIANAFQRLGQNADEQALIREIYKRRWGGGVNFARSTPEVKQSVYNRFFGEDGEMATALARIG